MKTIRAYHIFIMRSHFSPREKAVEYGAHCRARPGGKKGDEVRGGNGGRGADRIMGTHTPEHVCLASCGGPEVSAAHYGAL